MAVFTCFFDFGLQRTKYFAINKKNVSLTKIKFSRIYEKRMPRFETPSFIKKSLPPGEQGQA